MIIVTSVTIVINSGQVRQESVFGLESCLETESFIEALAEPGGSKKP